MPSLGSIPRPAKPNFVFSHRKPAIPTAALATVVSTFLYHVPIPQLSVRALLLEMATHTFRIAMGCQRQPRYAILMARNRLRVTMNNTSAPSGLVLTDHRWKSYLEMGNRTSRVHVTAHQVVVGNARISCLIRKPAVGRERAGAHLLLMPTKG